MRNVKTKFSQVSTCCLQHYVRQHLIIYCVLGISVSNTEITTGISTQEKEINLSVCVRAA